MCNALRVRFREGIRDLSAVSQRFGAGEALSAKPCRECLACDQLHDEVIGPDIVQGADVRVTERGNRTRLAFKPIAESSLRYLQRYRPIEPCVLSLPDITHTALADLHLDLIRTES